MSLRSITLSNSYKSEPCLSCPLIQFIKIIITSFELVGVDRCVMVKFFFENFAEKLEADRKSKRRCRTFLL